MIRIDLKTIFVLIALTVASIHAAEGAAVSIQELQAEAARGVASAQVELAEAYLEGRQVPVDEARALELMRSAIDGHDANNARAKFELAEMYATGMSEPRNNGETPFQLYLDAAKQGNIDAMDRLARRYGLGFGVERDLLEAARWAVRSSRNTGYLREFLDMKGEPLPNLESEDKVFAQFLSLYSKAQRGDDVDAMYQVGRAFLEGRNGKPNLLAAYFWLAYASRSGNAEAASLVPQAKDKLSDEEVKTAETDMIRFERNIRTRKMQQLQRQQMQEQQRREQLR